MFLCSGPGYLVGFKHTAFPVILQTPSLLGSTSLLITTPTQISAPAQVRRVVCLPSATSLPNHPQLYLLVFHFKNMGHLLQTPCTAHKCPICHSPMRNRGATRVPGIGKPKQVSPPFAKLGARPCAMAEDFWAFGRCVRVYWVFPPTLKV